MTQAVAIREDVLGIPGVEASYRKVVSLLDSVQSFADIERLFLAGSGLTPESYRSYLAAVRQLYDFTEGKHPLQVTLGDIEAFYDSLVAAGLARNTARQRITGLTRFFRNVAKIAGAGYASPFDDMPAKLKRKLHATRKSKTKAALTATEAKKLLAWLEERTSSVAAGAQRIRAREDYAIILTLVTSGLRASELLQLRWGDVEQLEGRWTAVFTQKGGDIAEQELHPTAVEATLAYFRSQFKRKPKAVDWLFWSVPTPGREPRQMSYTALHTRIAAVGQAMKDAGIITRERLVWSPHMFRRSFATILIKSGMSLKAVQGCTRHASIETLAKHYVDDVEPASEYLSEALAV